MALRLRLMKGARQEEAAVITALSFWDYSEVSSASFNGSGEVYKVTGRNFSVASGRISYHLGLSGPAISIDTACSGGSVAMHMARTASKQGAYHLSYICSVLLCLSSDVMISLSMARMLSESGRSLTLDSRADGYGRGEASVCLVISSQITGVAVIVGSFVNQSCRSASLTAPHGPSQVNVIMGALGTADVHPQDVQQHEMHGTGTNLGDPIEFGAMLKVHETCIKEPALRLIVSKSWSGHSEPAAGLEGFRMVFHHSSHAFGFYMVHFVSLNQHMKVDPRFRKVHISKEPAPSPTDHPAGYYLNGVSAFAFQGTNAHVVVSIHRTQERKHFPLIILRTTRYWFMPDLPIWMRVFPRSSSNQLSVEMRLFPGESNVRDHIIRGRCIMPGTHIFANLFLCRKLGLRSSVNHIALSRCIIGSALIVHKDVNVCSMTLDLTDGNARIHQVLGFGNDCYASGMLVMIKRISQKCVIEQGIRLIQGRTLLLPALVQPMSSVGSLVTRPAANFIGNFSDSCSHLTAYGDVFEKGTAYVPVEVEGYFENSPCSISHPEVLWASANPVRPFKSKLFSISTYHVQAGRFALCMNNLMAKRLQRDSLGHNNEPKRLLYTVESQILGLQSDGSFIPRADECIQYNADSWSWRLSLIKTSKSVVELLSISQALLEFAASCFLILQCSSDLGAPRPHFELMESTFLKKAVTRVAQNELPIGVRLEETVHRGLIIGDVIDKATTYSECRLPRNLIHRERGSSLIIGASGGLGGLFSLWQRHRNSDHVPRIVLVNRWFPTLTSNYWYRGDNDQAVTIVQADCSKVADGKWLRNPSEKEALCYSHIFHTAGVLKDSLLKRMTPSQAFSVLAPKSNAFNVLRNSVAVLSSPVENFMVTSSISYLIGNVGQGTYSAANACLDAGALAIRAGGIDAANILYGPWAQIGMASKNHNISNKLEKMGLQLMTTIQGLEATAFTLSSTCTLPSIIVAGVDWSQAIRAPHIHGATGLFPRLLNHAVDEEKADQGPDNVSIRCCRGNLFDTIRNVVKRFLGRTMQNDEPLYQVRYRKNKYNADI